MAGHVARHCSSRSWPLAPLTLQRGPTEGMQLTCCLDSTAAIATVQRCWRQDCPWFGFACTFSHCCVISRAGCTSAGVPCRCSGPLRLSALTLQLLTGATFQPTVFGLLL